LKARSKKMLNSATQADQKLLGDVTEFLIESTKFDLPQILMVAN
jgi:trigger factor